MPESEIDPERIVGGYVFALMRGMAVLVAHLHHSGAVNGPAVAAALRVDPSVDPASERAKVELADLISQTVSHANVGELLTLLDRNGWPDRGNLRTQDDLEVQSDTAAAAKEAALLAQAAKRARDR